MEKARNGCKTGLNWTTGQLTVTYNRCIAVISKCLSLDKECSLDLITCVMVQNWKPPFPRRHF